MSAADPPRSYGAQRLETWVCPFCEQAGRIFVGQTAAENVQGTNLGAHLRVVHPGERPPEGGFTA